jgi:hypothetical protein
MVKSVRMERFSAISSGRKNIVLAAMFGLGPILIIGILPINYDSPRKRCASDWVNREITVVVILTTTLALWLKSSTILKSNRLLVKLWLCFWGISHPPLKSFRPHPRDTSHTATYFEREEGAIGEVVNGYY